MDSSSGIDSTPTGLCAFSWSIRLLGPGRANGIDGSAYFPGGTPQRGGLREQKLVVSFGLLFSTQIFSFLA